MKPYRTKTCNRTFTGKGSEPLPVTAIEFMGGGKAVEACLEVSDDEANQIMRSKKIYIVFQGENIIPFEIRTKSITEIKDEKTEKK